MLTSDKQIERCPHRSEGWVCDLPRGHAGDFHHDPARDIDWIHIQDMGPEVDMQDYLGTECDDRCLTAAAIVLGSALLVIGVIILAAVKL